MQQDRHPVVVQIVGPIDGNKSPNGAGKVEPLGADPGYGCLLW
jgi:hypothetical protein